MTDSIETSENEARPWIKTREYPAMTDIKDNPPPPPSPLAVNIEFDGDAYFYGDARDYTADQYRAGEAAAFERGKAAMQEEIDRLKRESSAICKANDELNSALMKEAADVDELRAKLKALEEQEPVAYISDQGALEPTLHGVVVLKNGHKLYLAAGAKE